MKHNYIGSSFDNFLEEEEILAEVQAEAIKRVIAWQIREYLDKTNTKKTAFAKLLGTSRTQLDRLLDPKNTSLNLKTLSNAAEAMGKHVEFCLV